MGTYRRKLTQIFCDFGFSSTGGDRQYANVKLNDLKPIATLGVGGFGRVELVTISFIATS
jgi:hypothetical protein